MKETPDLSHNHAPVCPHCFEVMTDAHELFMGEFEGSHYTDCGYCGKEFFLEKHCSITYSTEAMAVPPPDSDKDAESR